MHFFSHSTRICKEIYSSTLRAAVYKVLISTYTGYACCSANRDITCKLNFIVNDIFCCYRQQSVAVAASVKKKKKKIYQTNTWPHIRIWRWKPFKCYSVLKAYYRFSYFFTFPFLFIHLLNAIIKVPLTYMCRLYIVSIYAEYWIIHVLTSFSE